MIRFKKYFVKKSGRDLEPHEIFLDRLILKRQKNPDTKELKFEVPPSKKALWSILLFSLTVFLLILAKSFQLSIIDGKILLRAAQKNFARAMPLRANRGIIYDQSFKKLVSNLPSFDLVLNKRDLLPDESARNKEIKIAAEAINKNFQELKNEIKASDSETMIIAENLSHQTLILLETEINNLAGFRIEKNIVRDYLNGPVFSPVLGYTGRINSEEFKNLEEKGYFISDYLGKQGLEKSYEEILKGSPGIFEVQKTAAGKKIKEGIVKDPVAGQSLVLWLDAGLQEKLYGELSRIAKEIGSRKAAAIAMDPKTGGILAMVSLPSFNNNDFSQGLSQETFEEIINDPAKPLFNRVVSGNYASGSTIKPLIAAAALQEKIISPEKQIYDKGFIEIKNKYHPEITYVFHGLEPHGWVDMREAIAVSSNIYFYTIGGGYEDQPGLGSVKIKNYLNLFGWGAKTNIDLPQETSGLIPDHRWKEETIGESWYSGDTYNLSIGQGFLQVSPLQMARSFAAIANNGKLLQPQIVKQIINGSPDSFQVVKTFEPKQTSQIAVDQSNLEIVRQGMRDAVIYGSSKILADLPVKAAAKTGTAQTNKANYYNNWVAVFAPYDTPGGAEIVLVIMIEDVPGVRAAALPVANETLKWYFGR